MRVPFSIALGAFFLSAIFFQDPGTRSSTLGWAKKPFSGHERQILARRIFAPHPSLPLLTVTVLREEGLLITEIFKHEGSQLIPFQRVSLEGAKRMAHFKFQGRPQSLQIFDRNGDGFGDLLIGLVIANGNHLIQELAWNPSSRQFELSP